MMMLSNKIIVLFILLIFLSLQGFLIAQEKKYSILQNSWWFKNPKGWYWYNEDNFTDNKSILTKTKKKSTTNSPKKHLISAKDELRKFREYAEEIKARAILYPTPANIKKWLEVNKAILDRSKNFALASRAVIYSNPELDINKNFPLSQVGVEIRRQEESRKIRQALHKISNKAGLIIFFSKDCPYCQKQLQAIKQFNMDYPFFTVFLMSKEFEACNFVDPERYFLYPENIKCQYGKGLSEILKIKFYPTTYIGIPSQKKYFLLGEGLLTESDIIDRLLVIGNYNKILEDKDLPLIYRKIKNNITNINKLLLEYKKNISTKK